ncbi:hypothetical protein [Bradyrhizobium sp.]|uniref:hypothetical protein n=1 Tax=Bradyrhizobium sp. TaxID=376 RepID=UPI003C13207E
MESISGIELGEHPAISKILPELIVHFIQIPAATTQNPLSQIRVGSKFATYFSVPKHTRI